MKKNNSNIIESPVIQEDENYSAFSKKLISEFTGSPVYDFISKYVDLSGDDYALLSTSNQFNIDILLKNKYHSIINLQKINDTSRITKFFKAVNSKLPIGGVFIGCVETNWAKRKKIYSRYPKFISFFYFAFYFIFKRIMPKLRLTKWLYFFITRGRNRAIAKAGAFGRLVYCGFEIIDYFDYNFLKYFVVKKIKLPLTGVKPSKNVLFKMRRIGKGGKIINVYKFRTMHPYSEFLQEYIYKTHNLEKGGKFKDDFRISTFGHFMRKFWIDELPMIVNVIKGDMKIIGVRPLSEHYFSLYSKELQERRIKFKPGLIPPFYVDNPETLDEIMASEIKYLDQYEDNPLYTDLKYFLKFLNIIFHKIFPVKKRQKKTNGMEKAIAA